MVQDFDELNTLGGLSSKSVHKKRKILDFETYFGEMELKEIQIEERIALAEDIEVAMLFLFGLVSKLNQHSLINELSIKNQFTEKLLTEVQKNVNVDDYMRGYLAELADKLVNTTISNLKPASGAENELEDYWLSDDRAVSVAENEANTICNYNDFQDAIDFGYNAKQWQTMKDEKVRDTHWFVDGEIKPIDEPFEVGAYLMQFPKDVSYGAGLEEIVNCRCSIKYLKN